MRALPYPGLFKCYKGSFRFSLHCNVKGMPHSNKRHLKNEIHFCQNYTTYSGKLMALLVDSTEKTGSLYGENKTWISCEFQVV